MRQTAIRALNGVKQRDFFGIQDITNKDIAGAFATRSKLPIQEIERKYDPLLKSRRRLVNEEKDKDVIFGTIRYDSDNRAKKHGQYEEGATAPLYDTIEVKQMFVPDAQQKSGQSADISAELEVDPYVPQQNQYGIPYRISDVQPVQDISETLKVFMGTDDEKRAVIVYKNKPPMTFYFDEAITREACPSQSTSQELSRQAQTAGRAKGSAGEIESQTLHIADSSPEIDLRRPQMQLDAQAGPEGAKAPIHELDVMSDEYQERKHELDTLQDRFDRSIEKKYDVVLTPEKPIKASQYLKKVRSKEIEPTSNKLKERLATSDRPYSFRPEIKLDSQGFRIYTDQVPDWTAVRRVDMLSYIRASIVYHNYDILAINKPYGLSTHSSPNDNVGEDVNGLVRDVAKSMRVEETFLVHRLDKTTTGVLLFATSKERAANLSKLFKSDDIKKTYLAITRGVPEPERGVIDLPLGEFYLAGKSRRCPAPVLLEDAKHLARKHREARRAITEYRVLDVNSHAALLELKPQTGVTHQLRCHLGFGLNTPILGDHKYSHLYKVAPQKLPPSLLSALRLRQTKVRTLPMHLHASSIVIPSAKANGETLFINAPLPAHFVQNMKSLKLSCHNS